MGRIVKPHGIQGEVVVDLLTERAERLDPGSVLATDRHALTVRSARPHGGRWLVRFEEITDRTAAEGWRSSVLRADAVAGDDEPDALWVHELVGSAVELTDGSSVGTVEAVQANPAADLLVLDDGTLVPVVFVVRRAPGRLVIDPPEGLLDL